MLDVTAKARYRLLPITALGGVVLLAGHGACSLEGLGPLASSGSESASSSGPGGGSSSTTSGVGSSSASSASSGGGGDSGSGGSVPVGAWPDSKTAFCSDGTSVAVACAASGSPPQDGTSTALAAPSYTELHDGLIVYDDVTKLSWAVTDILSTTWMNRDAPCAELNKQSHGGVSTWRVPNRLELSSLLDSGDPGGAIFGKLALGKASYWTSSAAMTPDNAFYVNFEAGVIGTFSVTNLYNVVCVSTPAGPLESQLTTRDNETAEDHLTGLMWQRGTTVCSGNSWLAVRQACDAMTLGGFEDWRLPTFKELQTLVDDTKASLPALRDELYWPSGAVWHYWSSTPDRAKPANAIVLTENGGSYTSPMADANGWCRCVRDLAMP